VNRNHIANTFHCYNARLEGRGGEGGRGTGRNQRVTGCVYV